MDEAFRAGIELFNSRKYFECHEALEALWLKTEGEEKVFLHGLIQIAAAFHHYMRRNAAGARSLLEKGGKKLERFGDAQRGTNLAGLRRQLQPWRQYLAGTRGEAMAARATAPPLPRIELARTP
jgi:predicted metal-dependent hydrolase